MSRTRLASGPVGVALQPAAPAPSRIPLLGQRPRPRRPARPRAGPTASDLGTEAGVASDGRSGVSRRAVLEPAVARGGRRTPCPAASGDLEPLPATPPGRIRTVIVACGIACPSTV